MADKHIAALDAIDGAGLSEDERLETLKAANRLVRRLENPVETLLQHLSIPNATTALQTFVDLELFEKWAETGIDKPMTIDKLSTLTGCDAELLARFFRHLVSVGYLDILDENTFKTNGFSALFADKTYRDMLPFLTELSLPAILQVPKFLKRTNYRDITDRKDNPFIECNNGRGVFERLAQEPEIAASFNGVMKMTNERYTVPWVDLYPTDELVKADGIVLVDVGGSQGQDIKKLANKYELPEGSLILQDLAAGLANAELPSSIKPMVHDFFTPQPVKGAKAYYLHRVFHDWPDAEVQQILIHLRDALKPGYSSILVHEQSVSASNPSWYNTTSDLLLLAVVSASERTDKTWYKIAESVGLKISRVHPSTSDSIYEMVLA